MPYGFPAGSSGSALALAAWGDAGTVDPLAAAADPEHADRGRGAAA